MRLAREQRNIVPRAKVLRPLRGARCNTEFAQLGDHSNLMNISVDYSVNFPILTYL